MNKLKACASSCYWQALFKFPLPRQALIKYGLLQALKILLLILLMVSLLHRMVFCKTLKAAVQKV